VELADGWMPMPYSGNEVSRRTPTLQTLDDLTARLRYAADHAAASGRTEPLGFSFALRSLDLPLAATDGVDALVEAAHLLADWGGTDTGAGPVATTRDAYTAELERLGEELVPRLHDVPTRGVVPG